MALRWGIVSAGLIANDFTTVLSSLPSSEHQVVAVAARDLNRAEEFAQKFNIPKAYGSYEELAKDPLTCCVHEKEAAVFTLLHRTAPRKNFLPSGDDCSMGKLKYPRQFRSTLVKKMCSFFRWVQLQWPIS